VLFELIETDKSKVIQMLLLQIKKKASELSFPIYPMTLDLSSLINLLPGKDWHLQVPSKLAFDRFISSVFHP
jgi:hypothetical protein